MSTLKRELRQLTDCILSCDDFTLAFLKICTYFEPSSLIRSRFLATATHAVAKLNPNQRILLSHKHLIDPNVMHQTFPRVENKLLPPIYDEISHSVIFTQSSFTIHVNPLGRIDFYLPAHEGHSPLLIQLSFDIIYLLVSSQLLLNEQDPLITNPDITNFTHIAYWLTDLQHIIMSSAPQHVPRTPILYLAPSFQPHTDPPRVNLSNTTSHPGLYIDILHAVHRTLRPFTGLTRLTPDAIIYTGNRLCQHSHFYQRHQTEAFDTHAIISFDLTTQFKSDNTASTGVKLSKTNARLKALIQTLPVEIRAHILNEVITTSTHFTTQKQPIPSIGLMRKAFTRQTFVPISSPLHTHSNVYLQVFIHVRHPISTLHMERKRQEPHVTHYETPSITHIPMYHDAALLDLRPMNAAPPLILTNTDPICTDHLPYYTLAQWL
jgi:hypothetical protein